MQPACDYQQPSCYYHVIACVRGYYYGQKFHWRETTTIIIATSKKYHRDCILLGTIGFISKICMYSITVIIVHHRSNCPSQHSSCIGESGGRSKPSIASPITGWAVTASKQGDRPHTHIQQIATMPNIVRALIAGFAPVSVSIRCTFGMTAALFWRVLAKRTYEQWAHSAEADVDPVLAGCLSKAALLYGGLAVNTAASYCADCKDAHKPNGSIRSISMRTTSLLLILLVWNAVTHYAMSRLPLLPVRERIRSPPHLFNPFRATIVSGSFQPLRAVDTRCPIRGLTSPPFVSPAWFPRSP